LDSFGKKERSNNVILIKNIPYSATEENLRQLFGWYGEIGRVCFFFNNKGFYLYNM